ncbi:ABC transporter ATP-binding protein [Actinomadura sp. NEAU-AAG7]|uniref:ABC transporter ATP-binding protein n=1 Tax=Actinomadura sp. NEAU-AAG7 TaxID=2839640 RepID=UPI001BE4B46C|nr:ABC transporter ATP-binding protein [Actinomadura sp. NEAU-AAG7]MBT2206889.1 ABC transporter ATP-binding protein/permease [Actinomadura sp. NEAU-AAG7]
MSKVHPPPSAAIDPDPSRSWLRRAWPLVRAHKWMFGTALVTSGASTLVAVQVPKVIQEALDNSVVADRVPLSHYVWWLVALTVIMLVVGYLSKQLLFRAAARIEYDLRNMVYAHLTGLSFPFYDRVQSGQLISRANSDIRTVQMYLGFAPYLLVQCGVSLVAFVYMLAINVPLAVMAMLPMPLFYVASKRMQRSMFPVSWLIQARLADVATVVDENVNGVRVVKSFAAERNQLSLLQKAATRVRWAYVKDADLRARWTPLVQNLPSISMAIVLLYGGHLVIEGSLGIGAIVAFSSYLLMLQVPFRVLGKLITFGQRASAAAKRLYEVLDEKPEIVDAPGALELTGARGDVEFKDVRFGYGDGPDVLDGFSLRLRGGETVALVGRTGSGKSTVARLLPRFYDVREGAVIVDGHDVRELTLHSLRDAVGIVLDEPFLFSASVRDNIAYGRPDSGIADIERVARLAGAHGFIGELSEGYDTVIGERGYTLSGGQRQRIAIARTLLVNPPVLVLDDATSAIDVQVEQEIHAGLRTLFSGRTTLIIAHRPSTISLADRVVLLDGGRVVADGTHTELLASTQLYAEVLAQADERVKELEGTGR